jgi:hypothetical protein
MFKIMNEEGMDCEVVFRYEDVDYIYSLAIRNPATGWVASGEHIGLRVFDNGDVSSCDLYIYWYRNFNISCTLAPLPIETDKNDPI